MEEHPSFGSCSQPPRPPSAHKSNQGPGANTGGNRHVSKSKGKVLPKPACISLTVVTHREARGYILAKSPCASLRFTWISFGGIQLEFLLWEIFGIGICPPRSSAHFLWRLIHLAFGLIGLSWEHDTLNIEPQK